MVTGTLMARQAEARKKDRERWFVQHFLRCLPDCPSGELVDHESPDFLIRSPSQTIGLEVRELFHPGEPHGGSIQAQEALRRQVLEACRDLYDRNGGAPAHFSVHFQPRSELHKSQVEALAWAIVERVGPLRLSTHELVQLDDYEALPPEIAAIHCVGLTGEGSDWSDPGATWVPTLEAMDIAREIAAKEVKLDAYRTSSEEMWLLLAADGLRLSGMIEMSPAALSETYATRFSQVWVFQLGDDKVHQLRTSAP